jgi:hypothetical protein
MKLEDLINNTFIKKTFNNFVAGTTALILAISSMYGCERDCSCENNDCSTSYTDQLNSDQLDYGRIYANDSISELDDIEDITEDNKTTETKRENTDTNVDTVDNDYMEECIGDGIPFCNGPKQILVQECNEPYSLVEKCDIKKHCEEGKCVSNVDCDFHKEFGYDIIQGIDASIDGRCCTEGQDGNYLCINDIFSYKETNTWDKGPEMPRGIVWNGDKLYCIDSNVKGYVYQFNNDGEIEDVVKTHSTNGIAWDGNYFWITFKEPWEFVYGIHKISTNFNETNFEGEIKLLDEVLTETYSLTGLTWDGNNFWVVENGYSGANDLIHLIEINEGIGETAYTIETSYNKLSGLEYKENKLWTIDYSEDQILAFSLDGQVVDSFNAPNDFNQGLAWQGNEIWITYHNSYYDNIIKAEVVEID